MTNLTADMQQAIEASLPASTANAMRDFIDEATETTEALAIADKTVTELRDRIEQKDATINKLESKLLEYGDIARRETVVETAEISQATRARGFDLELANAATKAAESKVDLMNTLVTKVFGHPSVTISTNKSVPVAVDGGGAGGCGYVSTEQSSEQTSTTESKT